MTLKIKKILQLKLALALFFATLSLLNAKNVSAQFLPGDINQDGIRDVSDVLIQSACKVVSTSCTDPALAGACSNATAKCPITVFPLADLNGDFVVDAADETLLQEGIKEDAGKPKPGDPPTTIDPHPPATNTGAIGSAAQTTKSIDSGLKCKSWTGFDLASCIKIGLIAILELAIEGVGFLLALSGNMLNVVIKVQNIAFHDQPAVNIGWTITRDVVNIFYILVLLVISIATILGISSYGMKQTLWKLILSALLINFSLPIAGIFVDFSNTLGNTFYTAMGAAGPSDSLDIAAPIVDGFKITKVYEPAQAGIKAMPASQRAQGIIIALIAGIIIITIASFVILVAAFLLIIRIVVIWILFILSPFAFFAYILPQTSGYGQKWFQSLFAQAFFYPAYMFFLYLSIRLIQSNVVQLMFDNANQGAAAAPLAGYSAESATTGNAIFILGFVLIGVLLIASLIVAKQLGAYGANGAIAYGNKLQKNFRGAVSGGAYAAAGAVGGYGLRQGQVLAGKAAGSSLALNTLGRLPIVSRGIANTIQKGSQAADYRMKKDLAKMKVSDPKTAAKIFSVLGPKAQAKAYKDMNDKAKGETAKEIGKLGSNVADTVGKNLQKGGASKEETAAFMAQSSGAHAALQFYYDDLKNPSDADVLRDSNEAEYNRRMDDMMNSFSPDQRMNIYKNELADNRQVQEHFMRNEKNFDAFTKNREGIELTNKTLQSIAARLGSEPHQIANALRTQFGNKDLADQFDANPAILMEHRAKLWAAGTKQNDARDQIQATKAETEVKLGKATTEKEKEQIRDKADKKIGGLQNSDAKINIEIEKSRKAMTEEEQKSRTGATILVKPEEVRVSRGQEKSKLEQEVENLKTEFKNQQSDNSGGGTSGEKKT